MGSPVKGFSAGAVLDFLESRFGGRLRERSTVVVVGTSIVNLTRYDGERVSLTLVNLGTNDVFFGPISDPSSSKGIRLGLSGGTFSVNVEQDSILPCLEYNAVSSLAGQTLFVLEVRRELVNRAEG
jgi:hypothetical protein